MNAAFPSHSISHLARATACLLATLVVFLGLSFTGRIDAQPSGATGSTSGAPAKGGQTSAPDATKLLWPRSNQVFPRNAAGTADIPILSDPKVNARIIDAKITNPDGTAITKADGTTVAPTYVAVDDASGKLPGVPTGGPYTVKVSTKQGATDVPVTVENVFVGDLWVLAGGSNMVGGGRLVNVAPSNPQVLILGTDGTWKKAAEPLMAPAPAKGAPPPTRGAGLGLSFASEIVKTVKVPVGLIAAAVNDSRLVDWSPRLNDATNRFNGYDLQLIPAPTDASNIPATGTKRVTVAALNNGLHFRIFGGSGAAVIDIDETQLGGQKPQIDALKDQLAIYWPRANNLTPSEKCRIIMAVTAILDLTRFSDLVARVSTDCAVFPVQGVLWFQGEPDALTAKNAADAKKVSADYKKDVTALVKNLRKALDQPDLPFLAVQLGRTAHAGDASGWSAVRGA
jgi:hypothetical protein